MKKMKTVFVIDRNLNVATSVVNEGCEWVLVGEGTATRKVDGSSCLIREGKLFRRFDCKPGRVAPEGFETCEETADLVTGHFPGWVPVSDVPADKFYLEAFAKKVEWRDGTFELVGPKINGGKENIVSHELWGHGDIVLNDVPCDFEGIRDWIAMNVLEGIVFHHPDGRMAKIRRKDFGLKW